jgi:hypothetical protein
VTLEWKKRPGRVTAPGFAHRLSMWAVVAQLVLAAVALGVLAAVLPAKLAEHASALGGWWVAVVVVAAGLTYAMTRLGLRVGVRNLARAQAAAEAKKQAPKP